MASEKAWYWLAAGVLALGLNGAYQDGQFGWAHCIAEHSASLIDRVSDHGSRMVAMAEIMLGRSPENMDRAQAVWGRTQAVLEHSQVTLEKLQTKAICSRVAMAQRKMALRQAQRTLVRADIQRKLAEAQANIDQVRMIRIDRNNARHCAGFSKVVVTMPQMPRIDLSNLPEVRIPDLPELPESVQSKANGPI